MGEFGRNIMTREPGAGEAGQGIMNTATSLGDLVLAMAEIQSRAERKLPPPQGVLPGHCAA